MHTNKFENSGQIHNKHEQIRKYEELIFILQLYLSREKNTSISEGFEKKIFLIGSKTWKN